MITVYTQHENGINSKELSSHRTTQLTNALWIDLLYPTQAEIDFVGETFHLDMPTKKDMEEIEPSSRLYVEDNSLFLTATMVAKSDQLKPQTDAVSFILTHDKLITVRHIEPQAFNLFINNVKKAKKPNFTSYSLLTELLETTTDRLADILEKISDKFDELSEYIFQKGEKDNPNTMDYKEILQAVGVNRILGSKVRDSLVSFIRIVTFIEKTTVLDSDIQQRLSTISKDITALSDYAVFISAEVNFLLDATLGMIGIEQNAIIKIFSVAAVIFLPPTLIASIYGMNFIHMPELNWLGGYPTALLLMILSAWLPYHYFRKKNWL